MTATDELRAMLDKRGAKYTWTIVTEGVLFIVITRDEYHFILVRDGNAGIKMWSQYLTPEQAIAATLGAGTCKDLGGTDANGRDVFNCSRCGCVLSLYDIDGSNNLCTSFIFDYPHFCPECGARVVRA